MRQSALKKNVNNDTISPLSIVRSEENQNIKSLLTPITNSIQSEQLCRKLFKKGTLEKYECVYGIYLNRKMIPIYNELINKGNYSETNFNFSLLIETALSKNSRNIIITHNHTSGNVRPSVADIEVTKEFANICRMLEINVIDHIIITEGGYYSFKDHRLLK